MNIKVLMSTMNKNKIDELELERKNIKNCVVVNQTHKQIPVEERENCYMVSYNETGLSKSRNRLIENLSDNTDVAIITDDDVNFVKNYDRIIEKAYKEIENADIIIFKSLDENGDQRRRYPKTTRKLIKKDILNVCSIEITFRKKSIKNKLWFDEKFGLGATYKSGEENVFLMDCYKKGLNIYFYNDTINFHPKDSTGSTWKKEDIYEKGALFKRLYPIQCFFMVFPIAIIKRSICETNIIKTAELLLKGIINYSKEGK